MSKTIAIIPARFDSTRFPGKVLEKINGKTMLQLVWEQIKKCSKIDEIIIATDDERIILECQSFGAQVELTFKDHKSGTDRCAQVATEFWEGDIIINVQADEPFIDPLIIDLLAEKLQEDNWIEIGTLCNKAESMDEVENPNVVKIVKDNNNKAMYFSRNKIPYCRDNNISFQNYLKHIGIYAFKNKTLQLITSLNESFLESTERLEQLRWIENGHNIYVFEVDYQGFGIDTPEDFQKAINRNQ